MPVSKKDQVEAAREVDLMVAVLKKLKAWLSMVTILPVDHYTALGISQGASDSEIDAAHTATLARISASLLRRAFAVVVGQSPARLNAARQELLEPASRREYDNHLDQLRSFFAYPPQ